FLDSVSTTSVANSLLSLPPCHLFLIPSAYAFLFFSFSFLMLPPPPRPTLFPYTTLFRSGPPPPAGCVRRHAGPCVQRHGPLNTRDRKSTRLNSSHVSISYAVFCLKKKKKSHLMSHLMSTYINTIKLMYGCTDAT